MAWLALGHLGSLPAWGFSSPEEASGVNLSLEEGFGARHQGMATRFAGFQTGADAVANAPAGMADVDDLTFSSSHTERFAEAQMDHFAALFPIDAHSTLGLGLARYGVSGIDWRPEGSPATTLPPGLFSTADYWLTSSFARRLGSLDLGASLQMLYRDLDQAGLGLRGDLMATYTLRQRHRLHALLAGALPSAARWSSGYSEYESPDIKIGAATRMDAPYFYGALQVAWETEGLVQPTPKSNRRLDGRRGLYHPLSALQNSNLGIEFQFQFGLALRAGLEELDASRALADLWHIGLGYNWRGMVGVDYSYNPHPYLPSSHQVAMQFTPIFPKFSGKGFRRAPQPVRARPLPANPTEKDAAAPLQEKTATSPSLPASQRPASRIGEPTSKPSPATPPPSIPASDADLAPEPAQEVLEE